MFRIERQQKILSYIDEKQTAKTQELAKAFSTSLVTIRNDINDLAARGLIIKTHGGAMCRQRSSNTEIPFAIRFQENLSSKQAIASIAAEKIYDGDVILLDAGSTTLEIANRIKAKNVTVITNDLKIATTLADIGTYNVIVAGGTLLQNVYTLVGTETIEFFRNIKVRKLFLGCDAIDFNWGITNRTFEESHVKNAMISAAQEVIAVADCSKFNKQVFSKVCGMDAIDVLITDEISAQDKERLENLGVSVISASKMQEKRTAPAEKKHTGQDPEE